VPRIASPQAGPPRLVLRFAAYTAITIGVAAGGLFLYVHRYAVSHAEDSVRFHTRFVADTIVGDNLRPSDFERPVGGSRLATLDRLFERDVLRGGVVRVKLYSPAGRVTYSTDHDLIGTLPAGGESRAVFETGKPVVGAADLDDEGGRGDNLKVLESYARVDLDGTPAGVLELYQDYAPVAASARETFLPIAGALGLALILLFATLVPMLRRVTRRLGRQMAEIEHQALHDSLTGLPNRLLFHDRVEQALREARRDGTCFAILLIDLDRFKEINDTLGHQSGDRVLEEVAQRLRFALRESDTVARLGGDEFALLARSAGEPQAATAVAERLHDALSRPFTIEGLLLEVEASIGVTLHPADGDDAETLIRRADVAMYVSKELHTPTELYSLERDRNSPGRLQLGGELRRALQTGELVVHYQLQANAAGGEPVGAEALVRWEHPERGLLPPSDFVPLAEQTGLIRPLTLYVLDRALRQSRAWHDAGLELRVSVNIGARDLLDTRLPEEVHELLDRWDVPPDRLELEITENTILTDPVRARAVLTRLAELGVRLAIDDFGSGNSSLGYLKRLPVDVLKIDKAFVVNMATDPDDAVIVRSTIELGHNLGLEVVAEGVESEDAWRRLAELECDTVQGFFLGQPGPGTSVQGEAETRADTRATA
jgi:diguanylate cyclase (GGDEF)-like protein